AVPRAQVAALPPPPQPDPEPVSGRSTGVSRARPDSATQRPAAQPVAAPAVVAAPAITEACVDAATVTDVPAPGETRSGIQQSGQSEEPPAWLQEAPPDDDF